MTAIEDQAVNDLWDREVKKWMGISSLRFHGRIDHRLGQITFEIFKMAILRSPQTLFTVSDTKSSHYCDAIMGTVASQITSLTIVHTTVYSDADQSKHQSSASLAFVWGIHRDRWIPRTKIQLRGKCFHLMTSSWICHQDSQEHFPWVELLISALTLVLTGLWPLKIFIYVWHGAVNNYAIDTKKYTHVSATKVYMWVKYGDGWPNHSRVIER